MNKKKTENSLSILESSVYADVDVAFLQEVSASFSSHCAGRKIGQAFDVLSPSNLDSDRDQNSFILLRKGRFDELVDETAEVLEQFPKDVQVPVVAGDLFVLSATDKLDGKRYCPTANFEPNTFP